MHQQLHRSLSDSELAAQLLEVLKATARQAAAQPASADAPNPLAQHVRTKEVAAAWGVSEDTVVRIFENCEGVLVLGDENPRPGRKRGRRMLLIPVDVLRREYDRHVNGRGRALP